MINESENTPTISVGIPFYNAEKFLAFAIQSVLCQSYTNWELILVEPKRLTSSTSAEPHCGQWTSPDGSGGAMP